MGNTVLMKYIPFVIEQGYDESERYINYGKFDSVEGMLSWLSELNIPGQILWVRLEHSEVRYKELTWQEFMVYYKGGEKALEMVCDYAISTEPPPF